jgi:hypothetical protein
MGKNQESKSQNIQNGEDCRKAINSELVERRKTTKPEYTEWKRLQKSKQFRMCRQEKKTQ